MRQARHVQPVGMALLLLLLLFSSAAAGPVPSGAREGLQQYVAKYRSLAVTQSQRERLVPYNYLIEHFSSFAYFHPQHRVNPDFIRALILAESNGEASAVSPRQARGLTQILLETGRLAAGELLQLPHAFRHVDRRRLANLRQEDLHDPAINILIACYLIAKYNHRFDGRLDLVVSAWNAGERSVQGYLPANHEETREMIGKVNGYFLSLLRQRQRSGTAVHQPPLQTQGPGG